jgi:predicted NBD/HSP70 family sugar kinase
MPIGIDLGGTKIEAQVFDAAWSCISRHRIATPGTYEDIVRDVAGIAGWARAQGDDRSPVGISAAGLVSPRTGLALTSNLPATGRPLRADIAAALGGPVAWLNDCRAFALSEAVLGAGRGAQRVAGVILGTGVGGGLVVDGRLPEDAGGFGGEFGHIMAPLSAVATHGLPVVRCGCGRMGCIETYVSGGGLALIARHLAGRDMAAPEIDLARGQDAGAARAHAAWCDLAAELLHMLSLVFDPDVIVLGGGVSGMSGLCGDLGARLAARQFAGFTPPRVVLAEGGDASGARGAALAAQDQARIALAASREGPVDE